MLPIRSSIPHPAESAPFAPVQLACSITTSAGLLRYAGAHGGNRPRPRLPWRSIRHGWGGQSAFAGVAIGLALTLLNLVSIPVDNASLNPARSTGPALIAGGDYLHQLWLFWVAPIVGAVLAGLVYRLFKAKAD